MTNAHELGERVSRSSSREARIRVPTFFLYSILVVGAFPHKSGGKGTTGGPWFRTPYVQKAPRRSKLAWRSGCGAERPRLAAWYWRLALLRCSVFRSGPATPRLGLPPIGGGFFRGDCVFFCFLFKTHTQGKTNQEKSTSLFKDAFLGCLCSRNVSLLRKKQKGTNLFLRIRFERCSNKKHAQRKPTFIFEDILFAVA